MAQSKKLKIFVVYSKDESNVPVIGFRKEKNAVVFVDKNEERNYDYEEIDLLD